MRPIILRGMTLYVAVVAVAFLALSRWEGR